MYRLTSSGHFRLTLLANEMGAFTASTVTGGTSTEHYGHATTGDMNDDGLPDLLTLRRPDSDQPFTLYLRYNNGDGTFGGPITVYNTGSRLGRPAVVPTDLDQDGVTDLVLSAGTVPAATLFRKSFSRRIWRPWRIWA
jgi:hypothetical protein